jgi:hypothetical protein
MTIEYRHYLRYAPAAGMIAAILVVLGIAVVVIPKEEPKRTVQEVQVVQVAPITEDVMLDSMVRAWSDPISQRFKKVCYDGIRPNAKYGFFVLYGPKNPSDGENVMAEGWWYVEQEFFRTSAGKYYTNDVPSLENKAHVYPDVTGLVCKDR